MKHVHLGFTFGRRDILLHDGPIGEGKKKGKTKFVIYSHYRTGSTLLGELLDCHPAIQCAGEVFHQNCIPQKVLFPCLFLEERLRESQAQAYCVSLKTDQVRRVLINKIYDPKRFLHKLHHKGWKFIHLKRRNILRQALSNLIANQRAQWHSWSESLPAQEKSRIDSNRLLREMEWAQRISLMEDALLQQIPHATFFYEDDLLSPERHQGTADRIFNFLSLPTVSVRAKMLRLSKDDISAFVENYSDLKAAVRQSKFAEFLED
jgi:hypothetical protein